MLLEYGRKRNTRGSCTAPKLTRFLQLIQEMGEIIGQEAKALGVNQLFAPVVDLARELRYGRVGLQGFD